MIKKIAHLADIHLRKSPKRKEEYIHVFDNLIKSLKKHKPDRIVIVGDIVHDYLSLGTEQVILARNFLLNLSEISPVIITRGNHDFLRYNLGRKDSVEAIISGLPTKKVTYYSETDFYVDDNVVWAVWHHGSKTINPWKTKKGKEIKKNKPINKTIIDLFHDKINNSITPSGYELTGDELFGVGDFMGDFSFLGDIHLKQYLNKKKTKAFCGSLIAQDFSEGDDQFHGYLLWDIENETVEEVPIENTHHKYINIIIDEETDFDDLSFKLDKNIKNISLRINWKTLPGSRNSEREQKLKTYINNIHPNTRIYNKNDFIEDATIEIKDTETIKNILEQETQHKIFNDFLRKIGVSNEQIGDILKLDEAVYKRLKKDDINTYEWDIVKYSANNFMSYENFDIDWSQKNGLFQITGKNTSGKTTLGFKFIPYMLYGKTLETETRMKYGDLRFINNRNNSDHTNGELILDVNGEYYAIKKETKIQKNREGEISGVPTKISYHLLTTPYDSINENNNVENLDENRKNAVQNIINSVVGSYDNFMRVVLTTSDTLNRVLSSDMSEFMDSLLYDSGLDIFDKKLTIVKKIEKEINDKGRITCDIDDKENKINILNESIKEKKREIDEIEKNDLHNLKIKIHNVEEKNETLNKNLHNIDNELYSLDINDLGKKIEKNKEYIKSNDDLVSALKGDNTKLPDTYDEKTLQDLETKRTNHKDEEFRLKLLIRDHERDIQESINSIEIIKTHILTLKNKGSEIKNKVQELKKNKICSECGQTLTEEHKKHIKNKVDELVNEMYDIGNLIKEKEDVDIKNHKVKIENKKKKIEELEQKITQMNENMEDVLTKIGILTNKKNDVETKKKNELEIKKIEVENAELNLKNKEYKNKITEYNKQQLKIEENIETNTKIKEFKEDLTTLKTQKTNLENSIYEKKIEMNNWANKVVELREIIETFKKQERRDEIFSYYKKCVHRDGIPKQMIVNYVLPKINKFMGDLLMETSFSVWLDETTLRPKIKYNERPNAIIDCISASGKERTYSSVVLKFALNQINIKSKPKILMLDEIMGKLDDNSVEEFIQILHNIKKYVNRVLVVEHNHNVLPDYLINVTLNENGLSQAELIDN